MGNWKGRHGLDFEIDLAWGSELEVLGFSLVWDFRVRVFFFLTL